MNTECAECGEVGEHLYQRGQLYYCSRRCAILHAVAEAERYWDWERDELALQTVEQNHE